MCFDCSPTRHTKYRSTKLPHIAIPCIALATGRIFAREGRHPLAMPRRPAPESPEAARVGGPPEELLAPTPSRPRPRPVARDAAGLGGSRGHRRKDASCSILRGSDGPCARLLLRGECRSEDARLRTVCSGVSLYRKSRYYPALRREKSLFHIGSPVLRSAYPDDSETEALADPLKGKQRRCGRFTLGPSARSGP